MRGRFAVFATVALFAGLVGVSSAGGATARTTASSGNWSDPGTWVDGQVPQAGDAVTIGGGHEVTYDQNAPALAGVTIAADATLRFAPDQSLTLQSTGNVLVEGVLSIRPSSASVVQTVHFAGVNIAAFVGGGMDPVASDVGLWVMGAGKLDVAGTPRTGWVRASGNVPAGATSVPLDQAPTGWQAGDEVVITPTEPPTVGSASYTGFDEAALTSTGQTIGLNRATSRPHPMVNGRWTAEVANLTRNVRIQGEPGRQSHVFIRSSVPQVLNYVELRYLGVEHVAGRYPVHIHMTGDGSRGTEVVGTVVRDADHHAFVPHNAHGITFRDTVAYNITSDAYWWDPPPHSECTNPTCPPSASHNITYEHALAAKVLPGGSGPSTIPNSSRLTGFELTSGNGDRVIDSTAVGVQGTNNSSGFEWNEGSISIWGFDTDNRTHNNKLDGIFDWQNTSSVHVLAGFSSYHNGDAGVDHGAYNNRYQFQNATLYGNLRTALELRAVSQRNAGPQLRFDRVVFDGAGISPVLVRSFDHRFDGTQFPTVFSNSTFQGAPLAFRFGAKPTPDALDVVDSTISTPTDVSFDPGSPETNVVRLLPTGDQGWEIRPSGRTPIGPPSSSTTTTAPSTSTTATTAPSGGTTYLSNLTPVSAINGSGSYRRDLNNHNGPIKLDGRTYAKGLGVYPRSELTYELGRNYAQFLADAGIDDICGGAGTVLFEVYLDGVKAFSSGIVTGATPARAISLDTSNTDTLKLVLTNGGDGTSCEYADWADARVLPLGPPPSSTTTPTTVPPSTTTTSTTTTTTTTTTVPPSSTSTTTTTVPPSSTTTATTAPAGTTTYLSDLTPFSAVNGLGPVRRDLNNNGGLIKLDGKTYAKGLGVYPRSEITYTLNRGYTQFLADVGIDDICGGAGTVLFEVYLDGVKAFSSGVVRGTTPAKQIALNTATTNQLRLVLTNGGDGISCEYSDWAGARLLR